jgi:hypothetical protein
MCADVSEILDLSSESIMRGLSGLRRNALGLVIHRRLHHARARRSRFEFTVLRSLGVLLALGVLWSRSAGADRQAFRAPCGVHAWAVESLEENPWASLKLAFETYRLLKLAAAVLDSRVGLKACRFFLSRVATHEL